jgi:hypothetical protein
MHRLILAAVAVSLLAVALTSAGAAKLPTGATVVRSTAAYPTAMVVLGADTAAGFGSDPSHPFSNAKANSWASGTNPAVKSVYSRLVVRAGATRVHSANLAEHGDAGTELDALAHQVRTAVAMRRKPELAVIQVLERSIKCDGTETDFAAYGERFGAALDALAAGLPKVKIVVLGQWGSLTSYVRALRSLPANDKLKHAGKKPCQLVDAASAGVTPERIAYVSRIVKGREEQLRAACARIARCRYDGGAADRVAVSTADVSTWQWTPSIRGQAKIAAAAWAAMADWVRRD